MSQYPPQGPQQPPTGPFQPQYPPPPPQGPYAPPPYPPRPQKQQIRTPGDAWQAFKRLNIFMKGLVILGIIFFASAACNGFVSAVNEQSAMKATPVPTQNNAQVSAKPTQAPTKAKPTPTPKPLSIEDQAKKTLKDQSALIQDKDPDVVYDKKSKHLLVMAYQGTSWDANGARDTVKMNCFGAQKAIWKSNLSKTVTEIVTQVFGPTVDKYGKEDPHGYIGFCKLSKETAGKFVWDNLTWNSAWDAYDDTWILGS